MAKHFATRYAEIGCRIPREYFCVIGWGKAIQREDLPSYLAIRHDERL
jgi:hypothetical protein